MHLGINYSRSQKEAEETVQELVSEYGITAHAIQADVGKVADAERVVEETVRLFGRIDVLVNNAGVTTFCEFANLDGLQEEDWDKMLNVNIKAPFFTARAAGKHMKKQEGGGCILNCTSGRFLLLCLRFDCWPDHGCPTYRRCFISSCRK